MLPRVSTRISAQYVHPSHLHPLSRTATHLLTESISRWKPVTPHHNPYTTTTHVQYVRPSLPTSDLDDTNRASLEQFNRTFTQSSIPVQTFDVRHARSSGAGGQNVNKVNTKVDMRFKLDTATWLPHTIRHRIATAHKNKLNNAGELIVTSERNRTQAQNYTDCVEKLYEMIKQCSHVSPKASAADVQRVTASLERANQRRVQQKKRASEKKSSRSSSSWG